MTQAIELTEIQNSLPTSWIACKLDDLVEVSKDKAAPDKVAADTRYIGLEHIEKDTGSLLGHGISAEVRSTKSRFNEGELLYGKHRPYLNKVYVAEFDGICSTDILVLRALGGVSTKYLQFRLLSEDFVGYANGNVSGVQHPRVNARIVSQFGIELAPLNEQRRIVEKVEELFTKLDAGVRLLEQTRALLRSYHRSVLKAAVEGELSRDWREAHREELEPASELLERILQEHRERWELKEQAKMQAKGKAPKSDKWKQKYKSPADVTRLGLRPLPASWCWLSVDTIAFVTKLAGFEYTKYVEYDEEGDLPVIKAENASSHGFIETNFSYVRSETVQHLTRSQLQPEDVLMVFVGAGVGKVARVPSDRQYFLGPNIALIRAESDYVMPKYLELFLRSSIGFNLTLSMSKATAQGSISMGNIRLIPCAVPPLDEQRFIVEEVERRLSVVDKLEATVEANLKQSDSLRQSILKQAFSGKLVPQDPDDEPASMMLERIREEHQTAKRKSSKGRRSKIVPTKSSHAEQGELF